MGTSSFLLLNFSTASDAIVDLLASVQSAEHLVIALLYTALVSLLEDSHFSMSVVDIRFSM